MGGLLKEALKSLCGVNQWSYAVFWKIGCQNTMLLIWEECYIETAPSLVPPCIARLQNPELSLGEQEGCWGSKTSSRDGKVHLLMNKMMINNRIIIVGQGLVGRAAFTGNHQWILANNYIKDAHPPEVLNEVHLQFSAGMQTVAIIPVHPHGVLQLGSSTTIVENMGFVNDAKSLIFGLGCIPGALLSNSCGANECIEITRIPISFENSIALDSAGICRPTNSMASVSDGCNQQSNSSQASVVIDRSSSLISSEMKPNIYCRSQMESGVVGAEVIHSNSALWQNPQVSFSNSRSGLNYQQMIGQPIASHSSIKSMDQQALSDVLQNHVINSITVPNGKMKPESIPGIVSNLQKQVFTSSCMQLAGNGIQQVGSSRMEVSLSVLTDQLTTTCMVSGLPNQGHESENFMCIPKKESTYNDLFEALSIPLPHADDSMPLVEQLPSAFHDCLKHESENLSTKYLNINYGDACVQPPSGDGLFDVLGADLKSKLLGEKWNGVLAKGQDLKVQNVDKDTSIFRDMPNVFPDHLPFCGKQISDDNLSCRTTLTKFSNSSVPSSSGTFSQANSSNQVRGELLGGLPKSLLKGGTLPSSSYRSGCSKDDAGTCSQTTSMYGSQISSWVEQGHNSRRDASVTTANSKRNNETTKPNRKRLKPGENPRPRPKDRQMIQDRVKELREIVPNGAKCSIDALLEKTIKHMLFLQSVTKHADKLKQTGESKIKENFEGGATWAFEVGSQSMLCPIVVEDLNRPRQMLVEMLCEERGFFLEIADFIRGLGLTILKGVMETRNDKIWAHFTVEANRDVTRVEIFMSLVRLLEQTAKGGSTSSANAFDGNNMVVQHTFPEAASIPAIGRATSIH
ncbi:Transcription factor LHW [Hibiscus syriacus]|uniref:Transcription factor LHW n=1 Tax=Hibiscus syriacus TaxID=106335 RepID=A0A6A3AMF7_HIBSY|nr:Transcription factor LHW [Hibiscus syriacus]